MNPKTKAEALIADIRESKARAASLDAEFQAKLAALQAEYAGIGVLEGQIKELSAELLKLMKAEKAELFQGREAVKVRGGLLLWTKGEKVSIPRDALLKIKEAGWMEAVKVVESVDRPVVEGWPDERLAVIGTKRKTVDNFSYELTKE